MYCFSMYFEVLDISIYVQYFTSFSMAVTDNRPSSKQLQTTLLNCDRISYLIKDIIKKLVIVVKSQINYLHSALSSKAKNF